MYNLDVVSNLLSVVNEKFIGFDIDLKQKYFCFFEMFNLCDIIRFGLVMDFVIFVVNVNELWLFINEQNVGIGYGKFFKILLKVIGQ